MNFVIQIPLTCVVLSVSKEVITPKHIPIKKPPPLTKKKDTNPLTNSRASTSFLPIIADKIL